VPFQNPYIHVMVVTVPLENSVLLLTTLSVYEHVCYSSNIQSFGIGYINYIYFYPPNPVTN